VCFTLLRDLTSDECETSEKRFPIQRPSETAIQQVEHEGTLYVFGIQQTTSDTPYSKSFFYGIFRFTVNPKQPNLKKDTIYESCTPQAEQFPTSLRHC
jgi:hypothetical protein